MPYPGIPHAKKLQVEHDLECGLTPHAISTLTGINQKTIERWRRDLWTYGSVFGRPKLKQGPPRHLKVAQEDWLVEYIEDNPDAFLVEMQTAMYDEFVIQVSVRTISETLKRKKVNRKIIQPRAKERSDQLRIDWLVKLAKYKGNQLVYLDETGANRRTGERKYGWTSVGQKAVQIEWLNRSEKYSILPAYTIDGYMTWMICLGGVSRDQYKKFVQNQVLPLCQPYPLPRSVLIMDNCRTH